LLAEGFKIKLAPFKASLVLGASGNQRSSQISTPNLKSELVVEAKT